MAWTSNRPLKKQLHSQRSITWPTPPSPRSTPTDRWNSALRLRSRVLCPSVVLQDPAAALAAPDRTPQRRLIYFLHSGSGPKGKFPQRLMRELPAVVLATTAARYFDCLSASPFFRRMPNKGPKRADLELNRHTVIRFAEPLGTRHRSATGLRPCLAAIWKMNEDDVSKFLVLPVETFELPSHHGP